MESSDSVENNNPKTMAVSGDETQSEASTGFKENESTQPSAEVNDSIISKSIPSDFSDVGNSGIGGSNISSDTLNKDSVQISVSPCSNDLSISRFNNLDKNNDSNSVSDSSVLNDASESNELTNNISGDSKSVKENNKFNKIDDNDKIRLDENDEIGEPRLQESCENMDEEELLRDTCDEVESSNEVPISAISKNQDDEDDNSNELHIDQEMSDTCGVEKIQSLDKLNNDDCDNSVASAVTSKDHEDSNPLLGVDETSMNLSETGVGSVNECERTRFLQCDTLDAQEGDEAVMDVIEVNAVDPFAQTLDSERCETLNDAMEVEDSSNENKEDDTNNVKITNEAENDMDVTEMVNVEKDISDVNEESCKEAGIISEENEMDITKMIVKERDQINTTEKGVETSVIVPCVEIIEDQINSTEQSMETSVSACSGEIVEGQINMTEQDMETSVSNSVGDVVGEESINDTDTADKTVPSTNDNINESREKDSSKQGENSSKEDATSSKEDANSEKQDTGASVTGTSGQSVLNYGKSVDNEMEGGNEKSADSVESNGEKLADADGKDEDVCIIPDTEPRVANNILEQSKLRSILKRISPSNTMVEGESEGDNIVRDYPITSSRPQRQAAKKADAQIKATVQQLDDDVEKENDEVEDAAVQSFLENVASKQTNLTQVCQQCCKLRICKFKIISQGKTLSHLCGETCSNKYQTSLKNMQSERMKSLEGDLNEISMVELCESVLDADNKEANKNTDELPPPGVAIQIDEETTDGFENTATVNSTEQRKLVEEAPKKTDVPPKRPVRRLNDDGEFVRICSQCFTDIKQDERTLSWETMDFCNEGCLGKYQTSLGSYCAYCKKSVQQVSLGKYCVRFGYDIRQFCCASCLEEFKKGLKVCSYCQKDISSSVEGFLAPVGDKGQFKDFCTQSCMEKYDLMSSNQRPPPQMYPCDVCKNKKIVEVEVLMESKINKLCSEVCFAAFKFVNTIKVDQCNMCRKYFDRANSSTESFSVYYEDAQHNFCCKTCMNVYILAKRKIVPCNWCKVKKYNFDMIKRVLDNKQILMMCSLNCLTLYQVSINAVSSRRIKCDSCSSVTQAQYHLTMSDATIRNFCNYTCVMKFQGQYNKSPITLPATQPIPTGGPKRVVPITCAPPSNDAAGVPVISSVTSLAGGQNTILTDSSAAALGKQINGSAGPPVPISLSTATSTASTPVTSVVSGSPYHVVMKPQQPVKHANKMTQCRPYMHTKGVSCKPHACMKETQTDCDYQPDGNKILIPVPVPIYIPVPMHMYALPVPSPMPIPLPIPVPIFIPTTRGSGKGIMKEIKKIQEKIPTDPFEAELLMMAEMVAGDKKSDETSSDSGDDTTEPAVEKPIQTSNSPETESVNSTQPSDVPIAAADSSSLSAGEVMETNSSTFPTEDMLQMALKIATELDDQSNSSNAVDLEAELPPSTIALTPRSVSSSRSNHTDDGENEEDVDDPEPVVRESRGKKRTSRPSSRKNSAPPSKRTRKSSSSNNVTETPPAPPPPPLTVQIPVEKPDAHMCLKFTFGVNAWKQWVIAKNAELEKLSTSGSNNNRKVKLFKPDILQLTADELNYSLCLFVKEARKPNGTAYAPDTIYYFCLGIQQYLFENGRIDNIFTDSYYEKFTECLDDVAKVFSEVSDDSKLIVTRVEEEHLWECKQLGAHSPHVLLSTLMFFNTKHFNLTTVDEHMQLSFSHIMKHWKRNPSITGTPGSSSGSKSNSRNVLLRFYPPQSSTDSPKKKKVYEQQENEVNPLRCPVKLYEFYLSKCPESVKTRNDVFYLLPERSCVPDSPVWYSTMALSQEPLLKMLHRINMVKEVNIALRSTT